MDLGLKGKVALVTAASRGLGKAAAMEFAREGARVAICARSLEINNAAQEIQEATAAQVLPLQIDLSQQDQVEQLATETLDHYGEIDILIINSGGPPPGTFLDLKPEDWKDAVNLTLMSAVYLCYAVIPHMVARGSGSIVTTQSVSIKQPIDNLILSNAIRMAVIGLMKSLANELGPKGLRVNSINPAWTLTERVEQLLTDRADRNQSSMQEEIDVVTGAIPLGRIGTPEEYGRAIAWLASPAASFIHGHALMFDGGMSKVPL
jgi:3-oxoacyl-[acyl-carrier protein] reductase